MIDRPTPHDPEAERAVLGSLLLAGSHELFDRVAPIVRAGDFYDAAHRTIFQSIALLRNDGKPIDVTVLVAHLRESGEHSKVGGSSYLAKLLSNVGSPENATQYAAIVADRSKRRRLIAAASEAMSAAYGGGADTTADSITGILRATIDQLDSESAANTTVTLYEAAKQQLELMEHPERSALGPLLATGLDCLDETYGGFRAGGCYVIAARPGHGKSALMKQIADSLDHRNKPSLIVSLEMEPHEIATRILSQRTGINGKFFEVDENGNCQLEAAELDRVRTAVDDCQFSVIHFDAPTGRRATVEAIAAHARLIKARHGICLLAVDYLQLMEPSHSKQSDYEKVTAASKAFKQLARELGITVLLLSQLNRDSERSQKKPRRPRLSDLRDSGAIEQDADGVIALHQVEERSKDFELLVLKWRNDCTGVFPVRLVGELTMFDAPPIQDHPNYNPEFAEYE